MYSRNILKTFMLFLFVLLGSAFSSNLYAEELANIKAVFQKIISSVNQGEIINLEQQYFLNDSSSKAPFRPESFSPSNYVQLYFPLNNNDVKYYQGQVYGKTYSSTYNYTQVYYNGTTCFLEYDSIDGSNAYYGYSGSNLNMYGMSVEDVSFAFNSPLTFLNDFILNNGGSLQSSATFTLEGYHVTLSLTVNSSKIGSVSLPMLGSVDNCRSIDMSFTLSAQGESETIDFNDAWILAPNIGKLRIGLMDQFGIERGWMDLTGGTVGGQDISDIITPIIADFQADRLDGFSPLTVQFTDQSSGSVNSWYWDFGDGTSSSSQNPQHAFPSPGTYTVSLTVTGPNGSDTESKAAYIYVKEKIATPWVPLLLLDE